MGESDLQGPDPRLPLSPARQRKRLQLEGPNPPPLPGNCHHASYQRGERAAVPSPLRCEKAPAGLAPSQPECGYVCWRWGRTGPGSGPSPSRANPTSLTHLSNTPAQHPVGSGWRSSAGLEPGCQGERGNAQMLEQGGGQAGRAPGKGRGEAGCTPAGLRARRAAQSYKAEKCATRHGGISGSSPAKCHPVGVAGGA